MNQLHQVLLRPIHDSPRARCYAEAIDYYVEKLKRQWDLEHGLPRMPSADDSAACETVEIYRQPDAPQRHYAENPVHALRAASLGRTGTAPLAIAAFAWHCPLSTYHGDPELLRYFQNGLQYFTGCIHDDGTFGACGENKHTWAHGWDVEGLIYGLIFCGDALDFQVRERALQRLRLCAARFTASDSSASHGNQMAVYCLGLWLYGQLLEMPKAIEKSDELWQDLLPKVLDDSGQVIEQHGPCMHYSFTCFFYCWLNQFMRGDRTSGHDKVLERLSRALYWFRYRHTESLYPHAGPSSRMHYENPHQMTVDLLGGCEQMSAHEPMFGHWAQRLWDDTADELKQGKQNHNIAGHGASPVMWAILAHPGQREPSRKEKEAWHAPFQKNYESITLLRRAPLKYCLVKRRYQTHFNFRDFLPFSGLQTWAWENEPPIIHPTILSPSTTQAWALDTARQGVSHNWAQFGAGAMAVDGRFQETTNDKHLIHLIARYDRLWRLVFFTDVSTLIIEWGDHGPRKTLWTLNRIEPADVAADEGIVSFAGRRACLHSTVVLPILRTENESMPPHVPEYDCTPTRVLEYDCGAGFVAFAFSDGSFSFGDGFASEFLTGRTFQFADSAGTYRILLSEKFFTEGEENLLRDPFHLAHETVAEKI